MRTHSRSEVLLARVIDLHRPKYQQDAGGKIDREKAPICTGCEVNFWPCPTLKLADGTWESVPT